MDLGIGSSHALKAESVALRVLFCDDLTAKFEMKVDAQMTNNTGRRGRSAFAIWAGSFLGLKTSHRQARGTFSWAESTMIVGRWSIYGAQLDAAPKMLRSLITLSLNRGWERVIRNTSASVKQPMRRSVNSSIVHSSLKHLVDERATHGLPENTNSPATVVPPTVFLFHDLKFKIAAMPLKWLGEVGDLCGTVVFLTSKQTGYPTGQLLQADGGRARSLS